MPTPSWLTCAPVPVRAACMRASSCVWYWRRRLRRSEASGRTASWRCNASISGAQAGDAGQQLFLVDRLDQVIACALAHAPDTVGFLVLGAADDDRHIG